MARMITAKYGMLMITDYITHFIDNSIARCRNNGIDKREIEISHCLCGVTYSLYTKECVNTPTLTSKSFMHSKYGSNT